jgi:adenosine deaminase
MPHTDLRSFLTAIPKIDLHRHLEGSIRLSTLLDVAHQYAVDLPERTLEGLRSYVQVTAEDANDAAHFLKKFTMLRRFFCAPEVIRRVAYEAVADAAADNVKYLELRFTPQALAKLKNFSFWDVIGWVCEGIADAQAKFDIRVGLIVSVNRHESFGEAERQLRAALDYRTHGVVGFDLCGLESGYPALPFLDVFNQARAAGLGITVHAGEWAGPNNIREAIQKIGARRIGHGVRIIEDSRVVQLARDQGVTFEVCPTSNVQSGVVYAMEHHPLVDMNFLGLATTINTDDPSISNITLTDELSNVVKKMGLSLKDIQRSIVRSAGAAFIPDSERARLLASIQAGFDKIADDKIASGAEQPS